MFLLWSYRAGDLTQVYPIARGTGPLVVALLLGAWFLNERFTAAKLVAALLTIAGAVLIRIG